MGKLLALMRHSKAHQPIAGQSDHSRRLNEKGIKRATAVGEILQGRFQFDVALVSSSQRTKETSDIIKNHIRLNDDRILSKESLYLGTIDEYRNEIESLPSEFDGAILIGHNPTISWLAADLVNDFHEPMATGSTLILELPGNDWTLDHGTCKLIELIDARKII